MVDRPRSLNLYPGLNKLSKRTFQSFVKKTPLCLALLGAIALLLIWIPSWGDRQYQYIATAAVVLVTGLLAIAFTLFLSGYSRKSRLAVFIISSLAVGGLAGLFRIDEVTGDLVPVLVFRWQGKADEALPLLSPSVRPPSEAVTSPAASDDPAGPEGYGQFLGPNRNATIDESGINWDWARSPPVELWRRPVGAGWSAFSVSGDRAITQEQRGPNELVVCYWLSSGEVAWSHADPARFQEVLGGIGPRATPTIAGDRVFTLGATGILNCLSLASGSPVWSVNILRETGCPNQGWGKSSSPLVYDGLVIVAAGGNGSGEGGCPGMVAYQEQSGEEVWRSAPTEPGYCSPSVAQLAGRPQLLILNLASVSSHDPATGETLWSHPWEGTQPKVTQPVPVGESRVLLSSGYGVGAELLAITEGADGRLEPQSLWKNRNLKSKFSNIVVYQGAAYGLDDGIMACIDLANGKRHWKGGRYGHGQLLLNGDKIFVLAEAGDGVVVQATTAGHTELSRHKLLDGKTWNHPSLPAPYLLVRNAAEAACYRLKRD